MRGRQVFFDSLLAHGVEYIFGNPGTTETPLLDGLADYPQLQYIVALHEGIAVGAASYYARASGKTGIVNLHVAPGLGNGLGMLYSASKANAPMIVTAGQQDTRMLLREPVLSHDLVRMAAPVTKWSVQVDRADDFGPLLRRAFKVANDPPMGPVFVALPINVMEQETDVPAGDPGVLYRRTRPDPAGVAAAAALLLRSASPAIVVGDDLAGGGGHEAAVKLAELIGASVWWEGLRGQASFPTGHPSARAALPNDAAAIRKALDGADLVLMLGGPFFEEVWFTEGRPFPDGAAIMQIEQTHQRLAFNFPLQAGLVGDMAATIGALREAVAASAPADFAAAAAQRNAALRAMKDEEIAAHQGRIERGWDRAPMSMPRAMAEIRDALPDNAVVVDETITANIDLVRSIDFQAPGDYFGGRGGGIGQGLAGAAGVKVAMPDRPVIAISGDGSAMYSIQALWTAAHHDLAIVFVILSNGEYRVLKHNADVYRQRFDALANRPYPHMDLGNPTLGFVDMARGMGVPAVRVEKADDLRAAIEQAFAKGGPQLVDVAIEGKR